ncbi:hypothetical protein O6H91_08G067400 [Diphasiastrum complanatum]|uniref:Uncharacterized protein n=2 Tax=Diphasiastrum complanatum TaxID=34168 RepID=A0ACC2CYK1_DIPCM|nr:hypothetical protein O6H91_08G067400 [Diphasiastrum complanatum]KAJ7547071.1 hypothetical protein O6H91_08G067400 [Diphasiastrum complanatum]
MGSSAELTLGCRKSQMHLSRESSAIVFVGEQLKHMQQLEDKLIALEEERRKVDAFKRELPLCMQLLNDAIKVSKKQLAEYQTTSTTALPLKLGCDYGEIDLDPQSASETLALEESISSKFKPKKEEAKEQPTKTPTTGCHEDKPSWMATAQLWSEHPERTDVRREDTTANSQIQLDSWRLEAKQACSPGSKFISNSTCGLGGAFSPFVREKQWEGVAFVSEETCRGPKLTLSSGTYSIRNSPIRTGHEVAEDRGGGVFETRGTEIRARHTATGAMGSGNYLGGGSTNLVHESVQQTQRKARRSWSPELHRRFVSALQQLGGSEVATPKQIRELMKVEGLTNDEVKSHLQKYRLHTRRPSSVPTGRPSSDPQTAASSSELVVLGGISTPPESVAVAGEAQKNPSACDQAPAQHQTQFFATLLNKSSSYLSSVPRPFDHTVLFEQQSACHSKTLLPRHKHSAGELSLGPDGSSEGCGEESIGDDAKSDSTNQKAHSHNTGTECFRVNETCRSSDREISTQEQLEEDDDGDVTEA